MSKREVNYLAFFLMVSGAVVWAFVISLVITVLLGVFIFSISIPSPNIYSSLQKEPARSSYSTVEPITCEERLQYCYGRLLACEELLAIPLQQGGN